MCLHICLYVNIPFQFPGLFYVWKSSDHHQILYKNSLDHSLDTIFFSYNFFVFLLDYNLIFKPDYSRLILATKTTYLTLTSDVYWMLVHLVCFGTYLIYPKMIWSPQNFISKLFLKIQSILKKISVKVLFLCSL